jgi:hypothetical protein
VPPSGVIPNPNPSLTGSLSAIAASEPSCAPTRVYLKRGRANRQWRSRARPPLSSHAPRPPASAGSTRSSSLPPPAAARRGPRAASPAGSPQVAAGSSSLLTNSAPRMACQLTGLLGSAPLQRLPPRRMCSTPRRSLSRSTSPTRRKFTNGNSACSWAIFARSFVFGFFFDHLHRSSDAVLMYYLAVILQFWKWISVYLHLWLVVCKDDFGARLSISSCRLMSCGWEGKLVGIWVSLKSWRGGALSVVPSFLCSVIHFFFHICKLASS